MRYVSVTDPIFNAFFISHTMGPVLALQLVLLGLHLFLSSKVHCEEQVNSQHFRFDIDEDVVHDHTLEGHVFKRLTVDRATECHMMCRDDCLCVSMNYFPLAKQNNCELNDVNKEMEPLAMKSKEGVNYYDLRRSYTLKVSAGAILRCHRTPSPI